MKASTKKSLVFGSLLLGLLVVSFFWPLESIYAQAPTPPESGSSWLSWTGGWVMDLVLTIPGWIASIIMYLASWLTWASGALLNAVIKYTVVDMSENLSRTGAINDSWRVIRDVSNMGFIFVLLFAAIQTILGVGKDTQRLIVRVVVVAVLINFSLFITRVVIDVSNVLALTFYDAIAPNILSNGDAVDGGIANSLMERLNLGSIYSWSGLIDGSKLVLVGIIGSILYLITAFVFFSIAIMFIMRFVVLIFVLVLSPLAFVSFVLPQAEKYRDQWKNALVGQAFFAPIYFMLTWIVILISRGLFTNDSSLASAIMGNVGSDGNTAAGDITAIMNFLLVIGLILTSLTIAKDWAGKSGPASSKMTSWLMGGAGALTMGLGGRLGRNTLGRAGAALSESEGLKTAAAKGGMSGTAARLALATGKGVSRSSFDLRATDLGKDLGGGKAQKGGFEQVLKDKRKKEKEFAESLGPSDTVVTDAERRKEGAKSELDNIRSRFVKFSNPEETQKEIDRLKNTGLSEQEAFEHMEKTRKADEESIKKAQEEYTSAASEVDRLKGVDEKEAIKRLKDSGRAKDDNAAKAIIEKEGRDKHVIKGVKDVLKEERVGSLERTPTYLASRVAEKIAEKVSEKSSPKVAAALGLNQLPKLIRAKNRAAIAEIRKSKKPVKEQLEEILKDQGEIQAPSEPKASEGPGEAPKP